jgi:protein ImuB
MAHWLCILLPQLALEIFARGGDDRQPLAVSDDGRRASVLACNTAALRAGVRPGMAVAAARALQHEMVVCPRQCHAEQDALNALAAWAYQFSAQVSLYPPNALLLEIRASFTLFGGRDALLRRLREGLDALGYSAQLAGAPTPLAALALARCDCEHSVEYAHQLPGALAPLPISVLDWEQKRLDRLDGIGVRRLGELFRLPRDGLGRRFGPDSVDYLDRLLGRRADPQTLYQPPLAFERRLQLPSEVHNAQALLFALQRLLHELCGWLQGQGGAVQRIRIDLLHREGKCTDIELGAQHESRDAEQWATLLRERLQRLQLEQPVTDVKLHTEHILRRDAKTTDLFGPAPQQNHVDLLDRLRARLGDDAIHGISAVADHRPEYAWRYSEPGQGAQTINGQRRPLWLLPVPRRLRTENGRPCLQGCLQLQQDRERIESGWWDGNDIARDYFIARSESGSQYWIYRELDGERRWFLQGVFE